MFDDENVGEKHKYYNDFLGFEKSVKINVPFAYQSEASGVDDKTDHSYMWYSRRFDYSLARGKRLIINFDGADYLAKVWLNGVFIGRQPYRRICAFFFRYY